MNFQIAGLREQLESSKRALFFSADSVNKFNRDIEIIIAFKDFIKGNVSIEAIHERLEKLQMNPWFRGHDGLLKKLREVFKATFYEPDIGKVFII